VTYAKTILFPAALAWRLLKKSGVAPAGSDVRSNARGPRWMNRSLEGILKLESWWLGKSRVRFPFGLSLMLIARRPVGGEMAWSGSAVKSAGHRPVTS
jgi:hypothetical protein